MQSAHPLGPLNFCAEGEQVNIHLAHINGDCLRLGGVSERECPLPGQRAPISATGSIVPPLLAVMMEMRNVSGSAPALSFQVDHAVAVHQ